MVAGGSQEHVFTALHSRLEELMHLVNRLRAAAHVTPTYKAAEAAEALVRELEDAQVLTPPPPSTYNLTCSLPPPPPPASLPPPPPHTSPACARTRGRSGEFGCVRSLEHGRRLQISSHTSLCLSLEHAACDGNDSDCRQLACLQNLASRACQATNKSCHVTRATVSMSRV